MRALPPLVRWNRSAAVLLSGFFLTIGLIVYVWWPLAEEVISYIDWSGPWWLYIDWLLIGLFLFMSLTIIARADLRRDGLILFVATIGGLVIEAWGTQTNLWFYYTSERPPLWIVPAWPIATLSIDRITRFLQWLVEDPPLLGSPAERATSSLIESPLPAAVDRHSRIWRVAYGLVFGAFLIIMIAFVLPTFSRTATILAFLLCVVLIATPPDQRRSVLVFIAGAGLGYFLELWGTTRECWTYYTYQTPPLFAVLAHGMAAVAFWRAGLVLGSLARRVALALDRRPAASAEEP